MKLVLSILLTFFAATWAFCQPENAKIELREGKSFYVHEVIQGNTLWGIQNLYKVSPEVILEHNPGVANGIKVGQILYIPVQNQEKLPDAPLPVAPSGTMEVKNVVHVVAAGETVYGISRQYDIKPDELLRLNPEAKDGLSKGQVLLIKEGTPQPNGQGNPEPVVTKPVAPEKQVPTTVVIFTDSLVEHTVQKRETLYSISKRFMVSEEVLKQVNNLKSDKIRHGDVLRIPLKKENFKSVPYREVPPAEKGITTKQPTQQIDPNLLFNKDNPRWCYFISFIFNLLNNQFVIQRYKFHFNSPYWIWIQHTLGF
jgi:LysM repeat protein